MVARKSLIDFFKEIPPNPDCRNNGTCPEYWQNWRDENFRCTCFRRTDQRQQFRLLRFIVGLLAIWSLLIWYFYG